MATTAARIAANQRNAQKSTGPKSAAGKAIAALNNLTHGLRAETVVLPGEDADEYRRLLDAWTDAYGGAGDPARAVLIERAVLAAWRLQRCARAEHARLADRVRHAADDFDLAARRRADDLGQLLLYEPIERGDPSSTTDALANGRFDRRDETHPRAIVRRLEATAQGLDWLLERWAELSESLDAFGNWHLHQMYRALRLLGRRPEAGHDDPVVAAVIVAGQQGSGRSFDLFDYFNQTRRGTPGCPPERSRTEARQFAFGHESQEAARAWLTAFVAEQTARLRALRAERPDALDRAGATASAYFDASEAGVLSRRYETACVRELKWAMAELQKELPAPVDVADETGDETPVQAEPAPEPAPEPEPGIGFVRQEPEPSASPALEPAPLAAAPALPGGSFLPVGGDSPRYVRVRMVEG